MKNYVTSLLITFATTAAIPATAQTTQSTVQTTDITATQFINQAALSGMKEIATGKLATRKAQDQKIKDFGSMMNQDHSKTNTELTAVAKSKNIKLPKQDDIIPQSAGTNGKTPRTSDDQATISNSSGTGENHNNKTGTTGTNTTGTNTTGSTATGTTTSNTTRDSTKTLNNVSATINQTDLQIRNNAAGSGMNEETDSLRMLTGAEIKAAILRLDALNDTQFDAAYIQMMIADHKNAIALFELGSKSSDSDIKAFATKHLPTLQNHLQQIQSISVNSNKQQTKSVPGGIENH